MTEPIINTNIAGYGGATWVRILTSTTAVESKGFCKSHGVWLIEGIVVEVGKSHYRGLAAA
jgi:hypothetical protein